MAPLSARTNWERFFPMSEDDARFHWTHCFESGEPGTMDLLLCNPPFHQGTTVGDFVARQMFRDAHRVLRPGGLLRVVGNSHLRYESVLGRPFGSSEVLARNPKFTIVDARKR